MLVRLWKDTELGALSSTLWRVNRISIKLLGARKQVGGSREHLPLPKLFAPTAASRWKHPCTCGLPCSCVQGPRAEGPLQALEWVFLGLPHGCLQRASRCGWSRDSLPVAPLTGLSLRSVGPHVPRRDGWLTHAVGQRAQAETGGTGDITCRTEPWQDRVRVEWPRSQGPLRCRSCQAVLLAVLGSRVWRRPWLPLPNAPTFGSARDFRRLC